MERVLHSKSFVQEKKMLCIPMTIGAQPCEGFLHCWNCDRCSLPSPSLFSLLSPLLLLLLKLCDVLPVF